jgi:peptidoglycan-associated lipoprotein
MRILKELLIVCSLIFLSITSFSQGNKLKKATDAYNANEWLKAIELYRDAYEVVNEKPKKTEIIFYIANCFRHMNDAIHAELWYKKTIDREFQNPIIFLYYADALRMQGKYKDAEPWYRKYKDLVPDDKRGENGIQSCQLAQKWTENPTGYTVEDMKFFNSRSYDYCPAYGRSDYMLVYFASCRDEAKGTVREGTGVKPSDIFVSKLDKKDKWSDPVPLGEDVNSEFEEGSPSVNKSFTAMYYTACRPVKGKKASSQIYVSTINGEEVGKGSIIELAGDSIEVMHPAIAPDENTLYFVMDAPGGQGGYDIWKSVKDGEKWGAPENLGSDINTPGNELYPYVHNDGTLYFSSDGHIGLGGLDIFKANIQNDMRWKVENMKAPINSASDDFGIVFYATEERGLFSSNRNGKADDIFSFILPPLRFNITGVVLDERTEKPLADATVKSISSDGTTTDIKTAADGTFKFALKPNTDYVFIALRQGYLNNKARETTKSEIKSKDYNTVISLTPIDKPIELPNIFYDFAKAELRQESMLALDKLVETLNDNPNVTIELMANTDYIGNDKANMELSQKRAQSVVNYLIEKGIAQDRLKATGNGESSPKTVDDKLAKQYPFLTAGTALNESFIKSLSPDNQEFANQINRRTEFKVLRTDYIPKQ